MFNNVRLPENGIVYFWAGEFAINPRLWIIDLDSGAVSHCSEDSPNACTYDWTISAKALDGLRRGALRIWRREPCAFHGKGKLPTCRPPSEYRDYVPGAMDDSYIIGGRLMASFSPLDRRDGALVGAVQRAIEPDR